MPDKLPLILNIKPSRPPVTIGYASGPVIECEVEIEGGDALLCLAWNAAEELQKLLADKLESRRLTLSGPPAKEL